MRGTFDLGESLYEERITIWLAESGDHAIGLAEVEAEESDSGPVWCHHR